MKTIINLSAIIFLSMFFVSCDHSENEALPDFLDGTEYGVLLQVNKTSTTAIKIANIQSDNVTFEVKFEGDQRPVESISVNKIFVGGGTTSDELNQITLTTFPSDVSLTANDLVSGVSGLSADDLLPGDKFQIKFTIKYVDGGVVTRFGTRLNPNFDITFE